MSTEERAVRMAKRRFDAAYAKMAAAHTALLAAEQAGRLARARPSPKDSHNG